MLAVTITNAQFHPTKRVKAVFTDVAGLVEGDDIRIAGVRVGTVDDIQVYQGKLARVTFTVPRERDLKVGTRASIRWRNLAGARYIALEEGAGPDRSLPEEGTIPVTQTRPALDLTVVFNGFRPLFNAINPSDVNKLTGEIIQVFQGEAGTVNSLLSHVASVSNTLANRDQVIGRLIENLNLVLSTVNERDEQLTELVVQLRQVVQGFAQDRTAIFDSLEGINELEAVTNDLIVEARPLIKDDVVALRAMAKELNEEGPGLDRAFKLVPKKLNALSRASSYGSWLNFYMCGIDVRIGPDGQNAVQSAAFAADVPRCEG
ncbi:MAG: MCE family protein [Streptosporangiales bacterium]|nr:MCE family protein [Streptosporangiales bacterium]